MKKILKNIYSQQGYADLTGLDKSTISSYVKSGKVNLVYTQDGKPLIKID